jgi:hypothetical protein
MLSWHPRNNKLPFWQFVNNVVNLFAHWLEVRRMQSALFILRIKYTSSLLGCQDIFSAKACIFSSHPGKNTPVLSKAEGGVSHAE